MVLFQSQAPNIHNECFTIGSPVRQCCAIELRPTTHKWVRLAARLPRYSVRYEKRGVIITLLLCIVVSNINPLQIATIVLFKFERLIL